MTQALADVLVSLDNWLVSQTDGFPHASKPYPDVFKVVSSYLAEEIHPHVEKGPLMRGDGFLTDHGPRHIATVIERASHLLSHPPDEYPKFSAYEVYLLLLAIHFHDIGNIYGRPGHEKNHSDVMAVVRPMLAGDAVEHRAIQQIARAHGGHNNGDKDTIARLPVSDLVMGKAVRYQALAAILRFSDELADDSRRAARAVDELKLLPKDSEVFHRYASALHSVAIHPHNRIIDLRYSFNKDHASLLGKGPGQTYLLDEIYKRTVKMHYEREYCMRFTHDFVHIDAIDVEIKIYKDQNSVDPHRTIRYRLAQRGYPGDQPQSIDELVVPGTPPLLTGAQLLDTLTGRETLP